LKKGERKKERGIKENSPAKENTEKSKCHFFLNPSNVAVA